MTLKVRRNPAYCQRLSKSRAFYPLIGGYRQALTA
jgi:hypothetical protein